MSKEYLGHCVEAGGGNQHGLARLHPQLLQTNAETGRLSTELPNLQCTPKPYSYAPGPACGPGLRPFTVDIRRTFVASPRCVLLSADYAQIELRLMAHFSADPTLCDILRATGPTGDPFRLLAARLKAVRPEQARGGRSA